MVGKIGYYLTAVILLILCIGIYCLGLDAEIMEGDSAQYILMSEDIFKNGEYLKFYLRGDNFLDKPPLLFWSSALSYNLFGVSEWAYRLPSLLVFILGFYSTYRLAKIFYGAEVGILAALLLASSLTAFLATQDVRTDTLLTGNVITSVWLLAEYLRNPRKKYFFAGFFFVGLGLLSKGPIAVMVPILAIGSHLLLSREFNKILHPQWLFRWFLGLIFVLILLLPMMVGLYEQFGINGLTFFFWTQSFGRITGQQTQYINDIGHTFFIHTFLWIFLPWSFLTVASIFSELLNRIKKIGFLSHDEEWISYGGFILPFIALSFSHYKLPHYLYVTLPFAAIFTAKWIYQWGILNNIKWIGLIQFIFSSLLWILIASIVLYIFPTHNPLILISLALIFGVSNYLFLREKSLWVYGCVVTMIGIGFTMNVVFYPKLLTYQSSVSFARSIKESNFRKKIYLLNFIDYNFDYYSGRNQTLNVAATLEEIEHAAADSVIIIYTDDKGLDEIKKSGFECLEIISKDYKHVTLLSIPFLNPVTRSKTLDHRHIIKATRPTDKKVAYGL